MGRVIEFKLAHALRLDGVAVDLTRTTDLFEVRRQLGEPMPAVVVIGVDAAPFERAMIKKAVQGRQAWFVEVEARDTTLALERLVRRAAQTYF